MRWVTIATLGACATFHSVWSWASPPPTPTVKAPAVVPAGPPPTINTPTPTTPTPGLTLDGPSSASGRQSNISFEDEIVAGIKTNPFDSVNQFERRDDRKQGRLYRKKTSYHYEMRFTTRETGLLQ